jgi:dihydropteroate synthase
VPVSLPLVMGVVNVTPDSFSDGGRFVDPEAAVAHGLALFAEGAAIVDVGGESTRPGAEPVDEAEELRRVVPVIAALARHGRVSVDTRKRAVAEAAVEAGATLVNDVSASLDDVVAAAGSGVGWIAMHMQGEPATMQADPRYHDVVAEVRAFLVERAERARARGIDEVWIDPGIGFGKTVEHNLLVLQRVGELVSTGFPVAIGTSRKGFLGRLVARSDARVAPGAGPPTDQPTPADDRLEGSIATAVWAMQHGVGLVRVHDVRATMHAAMVVAGSTGG